MTPNPQHALSTEVCAFDNQNENGTNTWFEDNWPEPYLKIPQKPKLGKHTKNYGQKGCFGKKKKQ